MAARADWTAWWHGRGQRELSLILWALWDPVGDVPLDEYDQYAPGVLRFLRDQEPPEEIAVHLSNLRRRLGAEPDPEHDIKVARKLQEWFRESFVRGI